MKNNLKILFVPVFAAGIFLLNILYPVQPCFAAANLGSKKNQDANLMRQQIIDELKQKQLIINSSYGKYIFTYPEINFESNIEKYLALKKTKKSGNLQIKYYLNNADKVVENIALNYFKKPKDASISFNPNSQNLFVFEREKAGIMVDTKLLLSQIDESINSNFFQIYVKTMQIHPKITENHLKTYTFLKSTFSTNYHFSQTGRKHNIWLGTSFLNGTVIKSGQEFSFNNTIGERTKDRGFESAKIIFDGRFIDGIGGGVCQISTTLYNACLEAGLKITEQHPHSVSVGYVPPSFDAMVNSHSCDLKFVNDTSGDIYIKATADGKVLKVSIYGQKNEYEYRRLSQVTEQIQPPEPEIVESDSQKTPQLAKLGIKSLGFLDVYKDGNFIKRVQIRKDLYKPVREIKIAT